jgi:Rod binding domain-containing protein
MNFSPGLPLKSFDAVRPSATGIDLSARPLTSAMQGIAGRFSAGSKSEHDQLVDQTQNWVAQTFFGTLLKQMRNSPFKSELFSGGQGGQAFAGLHDQQLAEHMARGAGSKLVNSIVRRIEATAAYRKQGAANAGAVQDAGRADNRRTDESREAAGADKQQRRTTDGAPARRP